LTYAKQCEAFITCADMLKFVQRQFDVLNVMFPEDFQWDVICFGRHTFNLAPTADYVSQEVKREAQVEFSGDSTKRKRVVDTVLTRRAVSCGGVMVSAT
jgi:hypothetical protein